MGNADGPWAGRVAIVTGISRRAGIGFAVAEDLLAAGASVLVHSWSPHDAGQPWGADPAGDAGIVDLLGGEGPGCGTSPPISPTRRRPRRWSPPRWRRSARSTWWSPTTPGARVRASPK